MNGRQNNSQRILENTPVWLEQVLLEPVIVPSRSPRIPIVLCIQTPGSVCFAFNGFYLKLSSEDWPWATGVALPAGAENQKCLVVLHHPHLPPGKSQQPMIDWCGRMKVHLPCMEAAQT